MKNFKDIKYKIIDIAKISFGIIIFIIIGYTIYSYTLLFFGEKDNINPEIYPAFRQIEIEAFECVKTKAKDSDEYAKCKKVADKTVKEYFSNPEFKPSAKEWYDFLDSFGYSLPIYKLDKQATEEESNKTMEEQEELKEILNRLIMSHGL